MAILGFPHVVFINIVRRKFDKNYVLFLIYLIIKDLKIIQSHVQSIIELLSPQRL